MKHVRRRSVKRYNTIAQAKKARHSRPVRHVRAHGRLGRTPHHPRRGRAGASPKLRLKGKYLDKTLSLSRGRARHIASSFVSKVRIAVAPPTYYDLESVDVKLVPANAECVYFGSPSLFYTNEMYNMAYQVNGNSPPQPTLRYTIQSCVLDCIVANATNVAAFLRVYECVPRHDIPSNESVGGTVYSNTPMSFLTQGFIDTGNTGLINNIAGTAFQSAGFVERYKIESVKDLKLMGGEQIRLKLADHKPFNVNMERWQQHESTYQNGIINAAAGRSRFFLFQGWGAVIGTSGLNTVATTSTAENNFNMFYRMRYEYNFVLPNVLGANTGTLTAADGTSNAAPSSVTNPRGVVEQTGLDTAVGP